jgi:ligand-binding sensor domain-containing protein
MHRGTVLCALALALCPACNKDGPEESNFAKVSGFVISAQGEKLLATDLGLITLDEEKGRYEAVESETRQTALNDLAFSPAGIGQYLWLASDSWAYNHTLNKYVTAENSGLHSNQVTRLHFDGSSASYFAAPDGLSILHGSKWTFSTGLEDLYRDFRITDIGTASNGYTYVTTDGGGVERFRVDVDGISGATVFETDWTWLMSDHVHTVFIDDTVQVYGTDAGVAFHFSEYTKWDWQVYDTADGLVNDTVLSVLKDREGTWWFGTARGISHLNGLGWTSFMAPEYDLAGNCISFLALDPAGTVWMACDSGLARYSDGAWTSYPK